VEALCGGDALKGDRVLTDFVLGALEGVRAKEGLLFLQADGASLAGAELGKGDVVSVLTAVGVHGKRSAYILHYALVRSGRDNKLPYGSLNVFAQFSRWEKVHRELGVVQEGLFARYPVLREAVRERKDPLLLVTTVERGHLTFAIDHEGKVRYVLVGETRGAVLDLLRGKGDPEEAKRVPAMVRLAEF
jgi:hypothetical protein